MAIPFRPLYGARPSVLPQGTSPFLQLARGLTDGFAAGRARAQEDDVPELMTTGDDLLGEAVLGNLMAARQAQEAAGSKKWKFDWSPGQEAWFDRALRNPATRDWANQLRRQWLANAF